MNTLDHSQVVKRRELSRQISGFGLQLRLIGSISPFQSAPPPEMPRFQHEPQPRFQTTQWSVVLCASAGEAEDRQAALTRLMENYWYPLYAFARRAGNNHHDALDRTQSFFAHVLESAALESVSPEKGRFRTFLLTSFRNFMSNEHRSANAQRRGGDVDTISLHGREFEQRFEQELTVKDAPEYAFDRNWVREILGRVLKRLTGEYLKADKSLLFETLSPYLSSSAEAVPRKEIAETLKLSAAAIGMSIHRMRRRYGELLREEVASTLQDPADVDDEIQLLLQVMRNT